MTDTMYAIPGLDYFITPPDPTDEEHAMKLIFCPNCWDMVKLDSPFVRFCKCGKVAGRYLEDGLHAVVTENAIVIGMDNNKLLAIATHEDDPNNSHDIRAWSFQSDYGRVHRMPMAELEAATLAVFAPPRAYWVCNYCQFTNHDYMHSDGKCVNCGREPTEYVKTVLRQLEK